MDNENCSSINRQTDRQTDKIDRFTLPTNSFLLEDWHNLE